jgi:DNA-binding transcriptional regulator PaaX
MVDRASLWVGHPCEESLDTFAQFTTHPERGVKNTVVRTTVENLVAKGQAQRTKQGRSVYYTSPDAPQPTPSAPAESQQGAQPEEAQ